jgi:ubiquinone/menaquinone biosynthesis C-methylase UbiE
MSGQKDIFLASEGDAWFRRNEAALADCNWSQEPLARRALALTEPAESKVLEIGCGEGGRLGYLAAARRWQVFGVDPSEQAVAKANARGVRASQGTAEQLPFEDGSFDVVMFGFCLYLCDDRDLFKIAAEADRVLRERGWLLILDFETRAPLYKAYHHFAGVRSRKMDYKSLFLWHPWYALASHEKYQHASLQWTDNSDEWVSVACLRKHPPQ